ncbi:MAG TPA: Uma2 family endonuclease [Leptolyngbyaceae cyanobacterium]
MSVTEDIFTQENVIFPSGDIYSDEPPLESSLHLQQLILLLKCLEWWWQDRQDFFVSGNLTIYYSPNQRKSEDFRGPDFFVVLGTQRRPRKSWVVWQEGGNYPNVIIEVLSDSTATTDRGLKKQIYQDTFRTPEYFWFDPDTLEFAGFVLMAGKYQPIEANSQGWLWSQQLELYLGVHQRTLRFYTNEGELVPTPEETAQREKERADQERERADRERERSDRLIAKLRELNIDPDTI